MSLTTPTLLSQRVEPSPVWCRASPKLRSGRGINRFPASAAVQPGEAAPRVSPPFSGALLAPYTRGCWWRERPPLFRPLLRRVRRFTGARRGAW